MINNKAVRKIQQSILCLTFISSEFTETVLVTFVTLIISLHMNNDSSTVLYKHLPFPQVDLLGFQL